MIQTSTYFKQQQQQFDTCIPFLNPFRQRTFRQRMENKHQFLFKRHEIQVFFTIYLTGDVRLLHVTYVYICINEDFLFMFEAVIE